MNSSNILTARNVLVSEKAVERARRDPKIAGWMQGYMQELMLIAKDPFGRPKESISGFNLSPQGNNKRGLRIAWNFDSPTHTLYVHDLLYHVTGVMYVDNWAFKVSTGKITHDDYDNGQYVSLDELIGVFS